MTTMRVMASEVVDEADERTGGDGDVGSMTVRTTIGEASSGICR